MRQRLEGCGHKPRDHLKPPEAGRGKKDPPPELRRKGGPAGTLISDLWPPELGEDKSVLF